MKIVVFGASGKVGKAVVAELLVDGHQVIAFTHSGTLELASSLRIVKGDVHNAKDVANALQDYDAVISTLGSWGTPTKDILSSAMSNIIPIMQNNQSKRLVTLTGSAAWAPKDDITLANKVMHRLFKLIAKPILQDAEDHLRLLEASNLQWTSIRASVIVGGSSAAYKLNHQVPKAWETIHRSAVAKALVEQITARDHYGQAPHIHSATH